MSIGSPNYRHGVRGARIALQTSEGVYGTPWTERGVQNVGENAPDSGVTTFYSEDTDSANVNGTAADGTLSVQFSEFSTRFQTDCLGHHVDAATGGIVKSKDDVAAIFAFGYEVQGTQGGTRTWKFGVTSSEPTATFATHQGPSVTESPQSCTFTVAGDDFDTGSFTELVCHEGDPGYATFLDSVPTPSVAA